MPNRPSQNLSFSSRPTLNTTRRSSFSMLHVSTAMRSTGRFWCAIQQFVTVHGLEVTSYTEIVPLREPAQSRSLTPSRLRMSDVATLTTSTHCGGASPPVAQMLMLPPSCER